VSRREQDTGLSHPGIGAAGAGAFGLALAAFMDVALVRFPPTSGEAIAAVTLMGLFGAVVGGAIGLLWARIPMLRPMTSSGLLGAAAGLFALFFSLGLLFFLGGELHLRFLGTITWLSLLVPPAAFMLFAAATRQLLPKRWAEASLARTHVGLWAGVLACVLAAGSFPLLAAHPAGAPAGFVIGIGSLALLARYRPGHVPLDGMLALVLGLLVTWPAPSPSHPDPPRPAPRSVVVLLLDTTRADALGPYGAGPDVTPVLDQLAAEGSVFEQVVSTSPWTAPSHASMFTGHFPRTHGVRNGTPRHLDEAFETTAERLADAGYQTAAISSNSWLRVTNIVQGFQHFEEVNHLHRDKLLLSRAMRYSGIGWEQWIDRGAAEAETAIDTWMAQLDADRPFFLFLNLFEAHNPYLPPLRDRGATNPGSWLRGIRAMRGYHPVRWHSNPPRQPWRIATTRALYRSGVRYQDRRIGRILEVIRSHVELDDILLIVTSDHGDNLGEADRWGHQFDLNDALIRVPFIARAPDVFPAGERIREAHQTLDLHATLLDWAGLEPDNSPARSLLPGARRPRAATFAEVYPEAWMLSRIDPAGSRSSEELDTPVWAIRRDGHKLVVRRSGEVLYDLGADPIEARDARADHPALAAALRRELDAWFERFPGPRPDGSAPQPTPLPSETEALDPETRRQLEALGYM
ncbi:MAG: sulfatase, partial [Deltaproteobacteria bacterium]|nr:sulfatase [Deltaproteobacteria bacterium]